MILATYMQLAAPMHAGGGCLVNTAHAAHAGFATKAGSSVLLRHYRNAILYTYCMFSSEGELCLLPEWAVAARHGGADMLHGGLALRTQVGWLAAIHI